LAEALIKHGVILAPGAIFPQRSDQVSAYCRFNVAYLADKRFATALSAIA
ncbi:MAG: PLP-dependent aminotransferase family protein, partial [Paraburkholderia fungorum]|nr:PLP-dependent aminotransferase family protein [Paraburkholderia fungorum]